MASHGIGHQGRGQAESGLRQAMALSDGNPAVPVTRPISAIFLILSLVSIFLPMLVLRQKRNSESPAF